MNFGFGKVIVLWIIFLWQTMYGILYFREVAQLLICWIYYFNCLFLFKLCRFVSHFRKNYFKQIQTNEWNSVTQTAQHLWQIFMNILWHRERLMPGYALFSIITVCIFFCHFRVMKSFEETTFKYQVFLGKSQVLCEKYVQMIWRSFGDSLYSKYF
jgi:hypothetical protein